MNLDQMFRSQWAKASDLQGRTIPVTIERVVMEEVGDGNKPVVYFQGAEKGLVLNKTNAMSIGLVHGQDTDGWVGKTIELFPAVVMFQGQNVPCIRVRPVATAYAQAFASPPGTQPAPAPAQPGNDQPMGPGDQAAAQAQETATPTPGTDLDDEIPF
jgi:hypothetical protein